MTRTFALFAALLLPICALAQAPGQIPDKYSKTYADNVYIRYGNSQDAVCGYNTTQTADALVCGLSTDSETMILMQKADIGTNMSLADLGTPTLVIANSDPTKYLTVSHNGTNAVIDTSTGVVSFPDGLDLGAGNLSFGASLVFEGATADGFETTLTVTDPTADRTVTLADASGTVMLSSLATNAVDVANSVTGASNALLFEGATANGFETSVSPVDPTADQTWSIPNFAVNAAFLGSTLTTNTVDAANSVWAASNAVVLEGATADAYELTLAPADVTGDRTATFPDASGTVLLGGNTSIASGVNTACTTTCGASTRCIAGQDADAANVLVACNSAAADTCLCSAN